MKDIHSILNRYWGHSSFRPLQEDVIRTVLSGDDCLALMPTGGGKSICFQVPALAADGLCLVISPLIALMKDQVESLRKKNITAFAIFSGMSRSDIISTLELAGNSNCKFLYVSPERLQTTVFREYLHSLGISLIAVDEAHCISQWGYDFRPSYLQIAELRDELPDVPVLALTASATPIVQDDIRSKLHFTNGTVFRQSFLRPNLSYSVFHTASSLHRLIEITKKIEGSAIVYCRTRKRTREISELLIANGVNAVCYHAGLEPAERNQRQDEWVKNSIRVIVSTNAFGMGIDKPDVRLVVHADIPECLENYYQEAGRAGRDGKRSYAVLLYQDDDVTRLQESADIKYPSLEAIRKIYGDLMDHLQVPAGTGEDCSYDFDLIQFTKEFNRDIFHVTSVLKTLEQEGLLTFNEQVFLPSTLEVTASRELLTGFEKTYPQYDTLMKTILRTYGGILDQPTRINERFIAKQASLAIEKVTADLKRLAELSIVKYAPQKNRPQIFLTKNRVNRGDLTIDLRSYMDRKRRHKERAEAMIAYAQLRQECRSTIIGKYFGDEDSVSCGICDVCIARKNTEVSSNEFRELHLRIMELISEKTVPVELVINNLKDVNRIKVMNVIGYLQKEDLLIVTPQGHLRAR